MNYIAVPELKPIRQMPRYRDIRDLLDGCAQRYGEDISGIPHTLS